MLGILLINNKENDLCKIMKRTIQRSLDFTISTIYHFSRPI